MRAARRDLPSRGHWECDGDSAPTALSIKCAYLPCSAQPSITGRFAAIYANQHFVFSSVNCVEDATAVLDSSSLWAVIISWSFVCFIFVALGRCADRVASAQFDAHADAHPALHLIDKQRKIAVSLRSVRRLSRHDSVLREFIWGLFPRRCLCCRREQGSLGVYVMNLTLASCVCRRQRHSAAACLRRANSEPGPPVIGSLAFLPDSYATALHSRLRVLLVSTPTDVDPITFPSTGGEAVLLREPAKPLDLDSLAAAEDDIVRLARTSRLVMRLWHGRWLILHLSCIRVRTRGCGMECGRMPMRLSLRFVDLCRAPASAAVRKFQPRTPARKPNLHIHDRSDGVALLLGADVRCAEGPAHRFCPASTAPHALRDSRSCTRHHLRAVPRRTALQDTLHQGASGGPTPHHVPSTTTTKTISHASNTPEHTSPPHPFRRPATRTSSGDSPSLLPRPIGGRRLSASSDACRRRCYSRVCGWGLSRDAYLWREAEAALLVRPLMPQ